MLPEPFSGPRLTLRPLTVDDVEPDYVCWMRDRDVVRYLESRFAEHTAATLRAFVEAAVADPATYFFAIVLNDNERYIGNIKLGPVDPRHRRGDIGIVIGERDCWGKGYATEAIEALCAFAFGPLGLHKVTAGAYGVNEGSIRAFLRAGFTEEGRRPEQYLCDEGWVDGVLLGRLASTSARS